MAEELGFSILSQLAQLKNAWERYYPKQAEGGQVALSGFNHQFLLTLLKIVLLWKESSEAERHNLRTVQQILAEAVSDITEAGKSVTFTQVKRTLSPVGLSAALEELWLIFNLAFDCTPELAEHLQFVISGQYEGKVSPKKVIKGWRTQSPKYPQQKLVVFKSRVRYQIVSDPKADLTCELQTLARDEDADTTISRWLGYLLQIGSGFSPESISTFIWKELIHDGSLEAFRATLAKLFSLSHYRLCTIRDTLGEHITLPRVKLSKLQACVLDKKVTVLVGPSGSGKSALCKTGIQQHFKYNFDCLFLHASDIVSFTESSSVTANRGLRRLDELLVARITQKPVLVVIDDLSDVNDHDYNAVFNLLENTLTNSTSPDIRFILVAHVDAKQRINEKIYARFGNNFICADVELPQLPIEELQSSENLPKSVISLIHRHREFGPALNLKLIDWLVCSLQKDQIDVSIFRNDLDLLAWFWCKHLQDGHNFSDLGSALIKIARELANKFTPDLSPYFDSSIENEVLCTLVRRDCLRIADEKLAITHRFVGDCARFHYLQGNHREIESEHLVEWLRNPFWVQPVRWFALQLATKLEENETWQELICEALEGEHLQLLDLLLDGAILSKEPSSVLQLCPDESLPFVINRLITRLLAIATEPYPLHLDGNDSQSIPLQECIVIQEQITGIPKAELWEPVWCWLLSQSPEIVIEESCIVFRAAEAWLNWSLYAEKFPLRSKVANFTLDLAQRVLLPDPDPQKVWGINSNELAEFKQQRVLPQSELTRRKFYYLSDFEPNAFSCIVFSLRIIPERSTWFLRALAGREIIPANKLEPTETSLFISRPGVGVLEFPHPQGPLGKVNHKFRKFMLSQNGLYLRSVILAVPQLGVELFLALTIQPPRYIYESERYDAWRDRDLGTEGSDDIDACTFKFLPLLYLLEIHEEVAIDLVNTLCQIATYRNYENNKNNENFEMIKSQSEEHNLGANQVVDPLKSDTNKLIIILNDVHKKYQGERQNLYWHRNSSLSPKIINCLLMTLEGWLYTRPSKTQKDKSISIILNQGNTVAILGVLVTLAKHDFSLLTGALLPLVSSIQLLIWLEFEQIDQEQKYGFDDMGARNLSQKDRQELLEFNQLSYRTLNLQGIILSLWVYEVISLEVKSKFLENWDTHQLPLVPEVSSSRALRIRTWFEPSNWRQESESEGKKVFRFIGTVLEESKEDTESKSSLWNLQHLQIVLTCRQIMDKELDKTLEMHNQLVNLLTSEEQVNLFRQRLEPQAFFNMVCAALVILLEPPTEPTSLNIESLLDDFAHSLTNLVININPYNRCQLYNLDAGSFVAHISSKLLQRVEADDTVRFAAFRCFISGRNCDTSSFMREWIREYGLIHPLTQELINVAPLIARLIALTEGIFYGKHIQQYMIPDGSYIIPLVDQYPANQEDPLIEEAWSCFQKNFIEKKLINTSIIEAFQWVPQIFFEPLQEMPNWLSLRVNKKYFDWDFLAAAFIPVLESKADNEEAKIFIKSICGQIFFALLHGREIIYTECKTIQKQRKHNDVNQRLYEAQSRLLDAVITQAHVDTINILKQLFHILDTCQLVDCILLEHIIDTLNRLYNQGKITQITRNCIASIVGDYLFQFRQPTSNQRILGEINDVWEKLIKFLSRESKIIEDIACADSSLAQFFNHFQEILFPDWCLRTKLYHVAKLVRYKQFRRIIFEMLAQHQNLLPSRRDDESQVLVQVLAEIWDSDRIWIIKRQTRCQDLRTLLGQLQEIDAVGARNLADKITSFLANPFD